MSVRSTTEFDRRPHRDDTNFIAVLFSQREQPPLWLLLHRREVLGYDIVGIGDDRIYLIQRCLGARLSVLQSENSQSEGDRGSPSNPLAEHGYQAHFERIMQGVAE